MLIIYNMSIKSCSLVIYLLYKNEQNFMDIQYIHDSDGTTHDPAPNDHCSPGDPMLAVDGDCGSFLECDPNVSFKKMSVYGLLYSTMSRNKKVP